MLSLGTVTGIAILSDISAHPPPKKREDIPVLDAGRPSESSKHDETKHTSIVTLRQGYNQAVAVCTSYLMLHT